MIVVGLLIYDLGCCGCGLVLIGLMIVDWLLTVVDC